MSRASRSTIEHVSTDNQARLNAVSSALIHQLTDAVGALDSDPRLRVIVLTGAGHQAFVGGVDVRELVELNARSAKPYITGLHLACDAIQAGIRAFTAAYTTDEPRRLVQRFLDRRRGTSVP